MVSNFVGANFSGKEDEAAKIQTLLNKIVEFSYYFPEGFENQFFDTTYSSLQSILGASTPDQTKNFGMDLDKQIVVFYSVLRKKLTEKKSPQFEYVKSSFNKCAAVGLMFSCCFKVAAKRGVKVKL